MNEYQRKSRRKAGFAYIIGKMTNFKTIFLEKFEADIRNGSIKSICDFGSGESLNFIPLLEKYPEVSYVGIEPSKFHLEKARSHLAHLKNALVYNTTGYTCPSGEDRWGQFDLVISLSVLEHVKKIESFLKNSILAARAGGQIVHRWDLGHALYPSSAKERLQVWLGDNLPYLLSENKFVSGLRPSEVVALLERFGVKIEKHTYHQMPNHKEFLKRFRSDSGEGEEPIRELVEWEFKASEHLDGWGEDERLKLFPAVALWGRKV